MAYSFCSIMAVRFADCDGLVWQEQQMICSKTLITLHAAATQLSLPEHVYHSHAYTNEQYAV